MARARPRHEIVPAGEVGEVERNRGALAHDAPVGQDEGRDLGQRIDPAQPLARLGALEEVADLLERERKPEPFELRLDEDRAPAGLAVEGHRGHGPGIGERRGRLKAEVPHF